MSEQAASPAVSTPPPLRWVRVLLGLTVVLGLAWLYAYLRFLDWHLGAWVEARLAFLPEGATSFLRGSATYVAVLLPPFALLIAAIRIGLWLDVRSLTSPRGMLDAYRRGSREGAQRMRESLEKVLRESDDLSPEQAAELRAEVEAVIRRTEEDAARKEKLYRENPALLENEMRMTMESIRAKQQAGEGS